VPGPQFPLYALGRELQELFPVAFLPSNHALAIAIISYNGGIDFGLLGDYDAMPDLDAFAGFLDDARQELVDRATAEGEAGYGQLDGARRTQNAAPDAPRSTNTRGRTSRPRTSSPVSTGA
jgi:hypothetical protein